MKKKVREMIDFYKNSFKDIRDLIKNKWTKDEIKNVEQMIECFFESYIDRIGTPLEDMYDTFEEDGTTRTEKIVITFIVACCYSKMNGDFLSRKKIMDIVDSPIYPI